jgi:S1-C subfamily serine protease
MNGLSRNRVIRGRLAGMLAGAIAASLIVIFAVGCGGSSTKSSAPPSTAASTSTGGTSLADVVQREKSGVVRIETTICNSSQVEQGIGTGFLVGPRYVATVEHVVNGASSIDVKQNGRELSTATVIGSDTARDLALLRLAKPVKGYRFRLSETSPRLGDDVAALGFPLGLPLTLTRGTVSGLDRTIPIENVQRERLVQTDAAVNPGNSGGPLLRTNSGEVIGLVDLGGAGSVHGIAFAVSSQVAAPLVKAWEVAPQPLALKSCSGATGVPVSSGSAGTGNRAAVTAFVHALDGALIESANTRGDLGQLINQVQQGSITVGEATSRINGVIAQRNALRTAVEQVTAPPQFKSNFAQLQNSIQLSLSDDLAIRDWINDLINGDQPTANSDWQRNVQLSDQASSAKANFLSNYNDLRHSLLGLSPLQVAY